MPKVIKERPTTRYCAMSSDVTVHNHVFYAVVIAAEKKTIFYFMFYVLLSDPNKP